MYQLPPDSESRKRQEKRERITHLQREANAAKTRLSDIERQLRNVGAIREANALGHIIGRLEHWQHMGR